MRRRPLGAFDDRETKVMLAVCALARPTYREVAKAAGMALHTTWITTQDLKGAGLVTSGERGWAAGTLRPTYRIVAIAPPTTNQEEAS